MERRYRLPIGAMVEVLKASTERVLVHAQIPALPGIAKKMCLVQLVLGQGAIFSCTVTTATGTVLLQQQEAYQAMLHCGKLGDLEWQVDTLLSCAPSGTSPLAQEGGSESFSSCIPTLRVSPLPAETLASFAYPYRMALILIDGKRSIHEIARLLSKSPADIQQMLACVPHLVQF